MNEMFSSTDLIKAKEAVATLLDAVGMQTYLFEVEPRLNAAWLLRVECSSDGEWVSTVIEVDKDELLASLDNPAARARLLEYLRGRLAPCLRKPRNRGQ